MKSSIRLILAPLAALAASGTALAAPAIVSPIDDTQRVQLAGNVRPEATPANDLGVVADSLPLDHIQLLLQRTPEREQALQTRIEQLQDKSSPNFHQWLTPEQLDAQFGVDAADLATVSAWLRAHGFTVASEASSGMVIDFSGNAGQLRDTFHTELHTLSVRGARHVANMSDPEIPAALAPVIKGIVSLHDFRPRTMYKPIPAYNAGSGYQLVAPADLATIYNLNPLYAAGLSGQGETIAVIEDTDVYNTGDWATFRSTFGLSSYTQGSFTQVHPGKCKDPGVNADEGEAILDAEWSSATAPSAAIELASCDDTFTTFGGLIALQNLIRSASRPSVVSISYGECEAANGAAANAAYATAYQQAVAEGISVFVSAGDEGAASCDADESIATHGISVSGFASTPYNVAVGGTDFGDVYEGTSATYWSQTNSATYQSVLSYVPEIPWNDSCAGELLYSFLGYTSSTGASGFCNSATGIADFLTTASGSGGPSGCAFGRPNQSEVVSGSCQGYSKPSWQSVVGNPNDGVRDIPDVSMFAANGLWGHYYPYCDSDAAEGESCTGAPDAWSGAGGTSFASPILAAIQAIVDQNTGSLQGNPNPVYYRIARGEFGRNGSTSCNSTNGSAIGASCVFNDVTLGDMDVNCTGSVNCYDSVTTGRGRNATSTNGALSTSTRVDSPAYGTNVGWDFATGLGSVNAYSLVNSSSW